MRYLLLACDFDGTLACNGTVRPVVVQALERVRASGRRLALVTGRELADLAQIFRRLDIFERIVAENGATVYCPAVCQELPLADAPPAEFAEALRARGVAPLSTGRVIVATTRPHEATVLETIRDLGLELQVIFNKDAVMVLPSGVNKASGLASALAELGVSPESVVAIGDAENDHALLASVGTGVAVADAVPSLREQAHLVTAGGCGAGVVELVDRLLATDLEELVARGAAASGTL